MDGSSFLFHIYLKSKFFFENYKTGFINYPSSLLTNNVLLFLSVPTALVNTKFSEILPVDVE